MKIGIVGGGIGALSTALACHKAGFKPHIIEKTGDLVQNASGQGLCLYYNALYCLQKLMTEEQFNSLIAKGSPVKVGGIRNWKGTYLSSLDHDFVAQKKLKLGGLGISRPALLEFLKQLLPQDTISLNSEFERYEATDEKILVQLKGGKMHEYDILVGADGIHSKVRNQLLPTIIPSYSGYTSWRAICDMPISKELPDGYCAESWGSAKRAGLIRLNKDQVYWFLVAEAPQENQADPLYQDELKANLVGLFGHFHAPVADAIELTDPEKIQRIDVHSIDPLPQYSGDRVVILGDSAHGLAPNLGASNCISIEDGVQLAESLYKHHNNTVVALDEYNVIRKERNQTVQALLKQIEQMGQMDSSFMGLRDKILSVLPDSMKKGTLRPLYDYEVPIDFVKE